MKNVFLSLYCIFLPLQYSVLNKKSGKEESSSLVYFLTTLGLFSFWFLMLLAVSYHLDESAQFVSSIYGFM